MAVLAVWLALLAGFLGQYAWLLDLFSHFRVQYAGSFALLALALLLLDAKIPAAAAILGAIFTTATIVDYTGWGSQPATAATPSFRVVSFNVWFRNDDYMRVASYLEASAADAVVLQELTKQEAQRLQQQMPSYPHAYFDAAVPYGAVVLTRWPVVAGDTGAMSIGGKRIARVAIEWQGERVTLLGVHLHWPLGRRNARLRNLELAELAAAAGAHEGPLIVIGDFNVTPWSAHFRETLRDSGLADCAAGQGVVATWPAQFPPLGIRIDHCLISRHWRAVEVRSGPYLGSDHRPLLAQLQWMG